MSFNIIKFLDDYNIQYFTSGPKVTEGWVNLICPFCSSNSPNLGIHVETGALNCWRCGHHSQTDLIKRLLNLTLYEAVTKQKEYEGKHRPVKTSYKSNQEVSEGINKVCKFPLGTIPLNERAKTYLRSRKFNPDMLEEMWGLKCTENLGDYKFRIVAPIVYRGKMVSYQCRDYSGKCDPKLKYKACKKEDEVIEHQKMLYGLDHVKNSCVVVEGIADVWRLGYGAVSCFGVSFSLQQMSLLAKMCKQVYILFDSEKLAQQQALKLGNLLTARGASVELLELNDWKDPGELPQREANRIMKELNLI